MTTMNCLVFIVLFLQLVLPCPKIVGSEDGGNGCSRQCQSAFCSVPPLLKYGKYCGVGYTGCPGEVPCDGLDGCCQAHDFCVQQKNDDLLSQSCNNSLLDCLAVFKATGAPGFLGNTCNTENVEDLIHHIIQAATWTGKIINHP
ncbi:hypothetical protein SUGI_0317560 [Cryptomeria japonica]|uniref:phospholipase A2-alpha n=1 Tax=Cryptomeria japonica TaxID=3369 RepID=UPI002408CF3F|nr:phospholipase A2-alpha [Cryptomeria japonica]GLJ18013.1 hypothetical protein SUGI_0317560 [Cryptomeria japonica]